ncbi:MAG: hypothetical protein IKP29_07600 [Pseudobutyrivibrio sp.]|nr:hypothetical protein [Pseudobutyrivibrio sp.]
MASEIAKAYVQLVPSAKGFGSGIKAAIGGDITSAGESAGADFGGSMVSKMKGVIAAAGLGVAVKETLEAGGALQQSFGGLDTLYEDASAAAKQYAREAVSAGINMNNYAEQAVSFGAALKSAFGGDTAAAAEAANQAILDMADNSAKMGTAIDSIQNAYQGFAKGNYTMLDNLKLGYGGTKTEMERLLADAEKLHEEATGEVTHYDIDNLGDVYSAIHDVQKELGLTGVAADEAKSTFTGSMQAMKATATNLMADISTGASPEVITEDLSTLFESVKTFVFENLGTMVASIVESLPTMLEGIANMLMTEVPTMIENLFSQISALGDRIPEMLAELLPKILSFTDNLRANAGHLIDVGLDMILNLAQGIIQSLPTLIAYVPQIVTNIANIINDNFPKILETGWELIKMLAIGLIEAVPALIENMGNILEMLIAVIKAINWLNMGKEIITFIGDGIKLLATNIPTILKSIMTSGINAIKAINWGAVGRAIINGIVAGLKALGHLIKDFLLGVAQDALDSIKEFFGIKSPSRVMRDQVGKMIPAGMAIGIEMNADAVTDATKKMSAEVLEEAKVDISKFDPGTDEKKPEGAVIYNQTVNVTTTDNSPDEIARKTRLESRWGLMTGGALG